MTMHMDFCEELGLAWPPPVPPSLHDNPWLSTILPREKEILCVAGTMDPANVWADTSQMMTRARFSVSELSPTITPGAHLFNFKLNRYLTGRDFMRGYPYESLPGAAACTDVQLSDLAGNSFSTSAICAVDVSLLLCAECLTEDDGTQAAVQQAMSMSISDIDFDLEF